MIDRDATKQLGRLNVKQRRMIAVCLSREHGRELDAIDAALFMLDTYDVRLDWHETAYVLDDMHRNGAIEWTRQGRDGFTIYRIP